MLYVDDLQVSCQGSDMRLIQRLLQTTVNRLVKWCDQNGNMISPSKSSCVHFFRKRNLHPYNFIHIGNIQIPVVMYGSARASVLKRLDTVHHSALRISSGAFRTSPVTSFYVVPGHVGILGNEQVDNAARSMSDHMQWPVCYPGFKVFYTELHPSCMERDLESTDPQQTTYHSSFHFSLGSITSAKT
ncbi:uncharacterized protein TNCV_1189801 [Trichonephila clavipes]|nr:uncharacterized protein TNCV_1189801 [Trichonephila clavipes]